jgi:hypothetical protein
MTTSSAARLAGDGRRAPRYEDVRPGSRGEALGAPVIVLTYAHSGAEHLRSLLSRHPDLNCTSGTGIIPLCELAAATWRTVDGQPGGRLSALAAASVRALTGSIITSLCVQEGKRIWCETATAPPSAAETFLRLYPTTKVLCLHRACADFAHAAVHASPWGLAGSAFAPFTSAHPASTAAALTAYWVAHTGPLIEFEQSHPDACHRVRYEDLITDQHSGLFTFLGLENPHLHPRRGARPDGASLGSGTAGPRTAIPADQIPTALQAHANNLLATLGYAPLNADAPSDRAPELR